MTNLSVALGLGDEAHEHDIERALVRHITRFLLELGAGFAFVGRQYRIEVDGDEFFIDLLFYHTRLKCYVVVELKATAFKRLVALQDQEPPRRRGPARARATRAARHEAADDRAVR